MEHTPEEAGIDSPTRDRSGFSCLSEFFTHVAEDVDWTLEGTHPLAGHYRSKVDFLAHTFDKLGKVLPHGAQPQVEHALVSGDWAVVELHSLATAKNGLKFDNRYWWVGTLREGCSLLLPRGKRSIAVLRVASLFYVPEINRNCSIISSGAEPGFMNFCYFIFSVITRMGESHVENPRFHPARFSRDLVRRD